MQTLNLKQLEAFCAVVDYGSFTAAAENIYLAQSTVSGHVSALEKELGTTLFNRMGRRRVVLTEEGRRVYTHAHAILQSCADLTRELEENNTNHLKIMGSSIPVQYVLPRLVSDFCQSRPGCRVSLRSGDSEGVHKALLNGNVQVGFAGADMDMKNMHYERIAEDPLVLIAPYTERYAALRKEGVAGNDLLTEPLIFREGGSGTQLAGQRFLTEHGIRPENLNIVAQMDSSEALMRAVACGMGCAVVSGLAASSRKDVLSFPLLGSGNTRKLFMLYLRNARQSTIAKAFVDYVLASTR